MKKNILYFLLCCSFILLVSCKKEVENPLITAQNKVQNEVKYAKGFSIHQYSDFTVIEIKHPWPETKHSFKYVASRSKQLVPDSLASYSFIQTPIKRVVVTSTTHIPSLVTLDEVSSLIGFPGLNYISSEKVRNVINMGKIKEIADQDHMNVELTIDLQPDIVVAHSMDGNDLKLKSIQQAGLAVILNGDWVETTPLGKAEWIKLFGVLYDKTEQASQSFNKIVKSYEEAKHLVKNVSYKPTVMSGAMYQDVWYMPQGESWMAQFIKDAGAQYLWSDFKGTGSLALSFETVFEKAEKADFWIGPAEFIRYEDMQKASNHYSQFKAFKERKIYTYSAKKGSTGGILFFEEAPNRPDLILKDLIFVFHPEKLSDYTPYFIEPLQ